MTPWTAACQASLSITNSQSLIKFMSIELMVPANHLPSPGDLPNPGIEPRFPALQMDSLPTEPQGKPKNTGMGSLSLLQGIFPTQESNQGLLHCRRVLYQLSYEEAHNGRRETKKHCFKDTYFEHCLKTKLCNNENSFKMVTWRKIKSRMRHI